MTKTKLTLPNKLESADVEKWIRNQITFAAPMAIVVITALIQNREELQLGAATVYILSALLDLFRQWKKQNEIK